MDCPFGAEEWVCNGLDDLCFQCADVKHANLHPSGDVEGCRECKLTSIQLSPSCRGQARNNIAPEGTAGRNSWERGIVTDDRGIPLRKWENGAPITVKEYADNRSKYEESRRRLASGKV